MVKNDAERARAYRRRQAVKAVSEQLFGGNMVLTLSEFFEGVEQAYDANSFDEDIRNLGEETEEHTEELEEVGNAAYLEAYEEAYTEAYEEAYNELLAEQDEDIEDDEGLAEAADEQAKEAAEEQASEAADEAVKEWLDSLEDYSTNRVAYALEDLIEAYRSAHSPLFD